MDAFAAAKKGNLSRIQELVTAANVDAKDEYARTVLHMACKKGHDDIVIWLLGIGADVNARNKNEETALTWATFNGHLKCIRVLLDAGADASLANHEGYLPLHMAAWLGHADCLALLVAACRSSVVALGENGRTALHRAAWSGHTDCCRLLLDAGSVVDALNSNNHTPLYLALHNNSDETAKELLTRGAQLGNVKLVST